MIRRRLPLILAVTLLGCVVSIWYALNQPRAYEATAVIQIEGPRVADAADRATDPAEATRRLQLIQQRLMSRDNIVEMIEKHDLFADAVDLPLSQKIYQLRIATHIDQIREGVESWQPGAIPSGLIITVQLPDAQKAADVANEFVAEVLEENRVRRETATQEAVAFFETEAARLETEIEALEARIAAFKRENADALPSNITSLRTQIAGLEDTILEIDRQIIALESAASRTRAGTTEQQVSLLQGQKALVAGRLDELRAALAAAPAVEQEFNALSRDLRQLQDQYSTITQRRADAELSAVLQSQQQAGRFEVLETALVPENPVSASRKRLALMGGMASLLAGLAAAFLMEMLNPAIRTAAQLERTLGISPVVSIPHISTRGERRQKWLIWAGALLAAAIAIPFVLRAVTDRVPQLRMLTGG